MSATDPRASDLDGGKGPAGEPGGSTRVWAGAFEPATRAMGPVLRAFLWVRGCPMRCAGCITTEFIPFSEGHPYMRHFDRSESERAQRRNLRAIVRRSLDSLHSLETTDGVVPIADVCSWLDRAIVEHGIAGVSFSGGEPFAQAAALAAVAHHAYTRGLSTLSWSGFTRRHLEEPRSPSGARALLAELDVLIDGPFIQRRANGDPLRGSSNQRIHLLTNRHRHEEFTDAIVEVRIGSNDRVVTTGVMDYAAANAALALLGVQ